MQSKNILETGTVTGFSAFLTAGNASDAKTTMFDHNLEMVTLAKENSTKYNTRKQIILVEGDAADTLSILEGKFDSVSMDSVKLKHIVFLPEVPKHPRVGGAIVFDDVFQGGSTAKSIEEMRHGQRAIYRGLQRLSDAVPDNLDLTVTLLPLSDGLLMICKGITDISL